MTLPNQKNDPVWNPADKVGPSQEHAPSSDRKMEPGDGTSSKDATHGGKPKTKMVRQKRPAVELSSLEQLIEHAYRKKGQKIALGSKQEKLVAQNMHLSDDAVRRLNDSAAEDKHFAVPVQLLLLARSAPRVRAAIRQFVEQLLLTHPMLKDPSLQATIRNMDNSPRPEEALATIVAIDRVQADADAGGKLKDRDFSLLKANLVAVLMVWIADAKGLSVSTVADVLHRAVWSVRARSIEDETAQLRALIEVDNVGVGVACQVFQKTSEESQAEARISKQEADALRSRLGNYEREVVALRDGIARGEAERELERVRLERQLAEAKEAALNEATHLRDKYETLRTKMLRSLKSDMSLLESGLEALRRPVPKVAVLEDAVERVTDSLRRGILQTQEER